MVVLEAWRGMSAIEEARTDFGVCITEKIWFRRARDGDQICSVSLNRERRRNGMHQGAGRIRTGISTRDGDRVGSSRRAAAATTRIGGASGTSNLVDEDGEQDAG